ncbi:MAG: hypothetical protein IIC18_06305 [Bacteroidetes bacterium]|nr:hypothetical protein [Bacteroidota bacterium]
MQARISQGVDILERVVNNPGMAIDPNRIKEEMLGIRQPAAEAVEAMKTRLMTGDRMMKFQEDLLMQEMDIGIADQEGMTVEEFMELHGPDSADPASPAPAVPPSKTSGDTAWAEITPVSPADAPFSFDELDTFLTGRARLDPGGYFVDSAAPSSPPHSTPKPKPNLEKAASAVQRAAYPELFEPISPANPTTDFRQALADAYAQRETTPFLVMALRIPEDDPYADVFPAVTEGVRIGVGQSGTLLAESYRLIALIPNAGADVARNVFAILKAHLKTIVPGKADAALQHVNAMAAPNGEPFKTADELFGYAFEK